MVRKNGFVSRETVIYCFQFRSAFPPFCRISFSQFNSFTFGRKMNIFFMWPWTLAHYETDLDRSSYQTSRSEVILFDSNHTNAETACSTSTTKWSVKNRPAQEIWKNTPRRNVDVPFGGFTCGGLLTVTAAGSERRVIGMRSSVRYDRESCLSRHAGREDDAVSEVARLVSYA